MRSTHLRTTILGLGLGAVLATAGAAASSSSKEVAPFSYTYRVTSLTVVGTFTMGDATTTTHIKYRTPSRSVNMSWWGRRDARLYNGVGAITTAFAGSATHTSGDPKCARTLDVSSAGYSPSVALALTGARDHPVTNPTIYVRVGKFPLVTGYPVRPDGTCGKVARDWWDSAKQVFPFRILKQSGFTMNVHYQEAFDDGEAIDWTMKMTVRRVRLRAIPCGPSGGC